MRKTLLIAALFAFAGSAFAAPVTYKLDPGQTNVLASWNHYGYSNQSINFGQVDGTLVFIEVRQRASANQGGAAASIGRTKQRRIVWAARYFLLHCTTTPPCRFDAVLLQGRLGDPSCTVTWVPGAFDASWA